VHPAAFATSADPAACVTPDPAANAGGHSPFYRAVPAWRLPLGVLPILAAK
jgi:hypothetical protein